MLTSLAVSLALLSAAPGNRCSVSTLRDNPEGYFWPLERIERFVTDAEVIVRARASGIRFARENRAPADPATVVRFEILEVIKGKAPTDLEVRGRFVDKDDFNNGPVPYRIVRPAGQRGSCIADEYRESGEYLLILRVDSNHTPELNAPESLRLTPYWAALAPLNEQIRGANDPWVQWVKEILARRRQSLASGTLRIDGSGTPRARREQCVPAF